MLPCVAKFTIISLGQSVQPPHSPHIYTHAHVQALWLRLPALSSCEALEVREMLLQKFINLLCLHEENPKMSQ